MSGDRDRLNRAQAVRAALARAQCPTVYRTTYAPGQGRHANAEIGWQLERQRHPLAMFGFNLQYVKQQLCRRGYGKYIKHIVNRFWKHKTRRHRRR